MTIHNLKHLRAGYNTIIYGRNGLNKPIVVEVQGVVSLDCKAALDEVFKRLKNVLKDQFADVCNGLTIRIGDDLVEGGGEAKAEENLILLDRKKMTMTLQDAEDLLVKIELFNPGERTKTLVGLADKPWSCLIYELIHETGHIADWKLPGAKYNRVDPQLSPTKYGKKNPWEAFAEIFTYWVLGTPLDDATRKIINMTFSRP